MSRRKAKPRRRFQDVVLVVLFFCVGLLTWGFIFSIPAAEPASPVARTSSGLESTTPPGPHLTTKELYDKIPFEDVDGGAWKQGWEVSYKGHEWDQEPLNVFVVPHSHNDPGWIRTVEEYYQERTRHILATVISALLKDKRRKFIWEEMSYLHRWWQDASPSQKSDLSRLVNSGQLEVVGGGWVMNDEANSHYFAILEQMSVGNLWLLDTLGVAPSNSWAIDPFGHSPTMAYLLHRMGFHNMLIQRTHYEVKKALAWEQNLEFNWRQSWDTGNTTDILCHMMPFYSYDIPHTCGPEPAVCCQFDYWRLPRVYSGVQRCPWGQNPEEVTAGNVGHKAKLLLDQYRKKSMLYKSNTLLVPLGDDFRYIKAEEAELQFTNYQALFDYINKHSSQLKATVQFGTLSDYFMALRKAAPKLPSLSGDFFTYADRVHDYWSGYYVSRPFYKAVDRVLEETLRAADILFSFSLSSCRPKDTAAFPLSYSSNILSARRNLALFQHHDGVTGTAKDHVVEDYGQRMYESLVHLQDFMALAVQALLQGACRQAKKQYEPEQSRSKFNVLPLKKPVFTRTEEGRQQQQVRRLIFYNPLEETVEQVVTTVTEDPSVCVFDSSWKPVESQHSPEWVHGQQDVFGGRHRLHWAATIPPMGLATYFVMAAADCPKMATPAKLTVYNAALSSFSCPRPYTCSSGTAGEEVQISNQYSELSFDSSKGLMVRWSSGSMAFAVEEDVCYYSSAGSGAYLFLPDGEARTLVRPGGLVLVTRGRLMQEVHTVFQSNLGGTPVSRSSRLYAGSLASVQARAVDIKYHVELTEGRYNDKEVVARFKTGMQTGRVFYSDLNGFQTIRRESYDKIPLQGNYYPMPSLAFMQDPSGSRFSVHSRQAVGVASLQSGWLEMMLDRRLTRDDGRGLGQGVLDNRPLNVDFHLLLEHNTSASLHPSHPVSRLPSLLSHRVGARLNYPVHVFLATRLEQANNTGKGKTWSGLAAVEVPCDLHLVSLKPLRPERQEEPVVYGLTLQRRGWDRSYAAVPCRTLAAGLDITSLTRLGVRKVIPTSLNLVHDREEQRPVRLGRKAKRDTGFWMEPMEIQAYKLVTSTSVTVTSS